MAIPVETADQSSLIPAKARLPPVGVRHLEHSAHPRARLQIETYDEKRERYRITHDRFSAGRQQIYHNVFLRDEEIDESVLLAIAADRLEHTGRSPEALASIQDALKHLAATRMTANYK
jgi:hypothetical protein